MRIAKQGCGLSRPNLRNQASRNRCGSCRLLDAIAFANAEREDGIFPLLTTDRQLTAEDVLRAHKRQPIIEKRFSQLKTDFAVAPVDLKDMGRIQGLLAIYFFVLLDQ